jgi:isocitrate dehydrogenase kinase/phosphatase
MPSARDTADLLLAAHVGWRDAFLEVTRRAGDRFEERDWRAGQRDAEERLTLYPRAVEATVGRLEGSRAAIDRGELKRLFAQRIRDLPDAEIAETFFNSVVRRVYGTVGVDHGSEFTARGAVSPPASMPPDQICRLSANGIDGELFGRIFRSVPVRGKFADLDADAEACAAKAREELGEAAAEVRSVDLLPFLFYRNKAAYVVARLALSDGETLPLVVPLLHPKEGVRPDAVLTARDEVHVVFSFARSYFHVATDRPGETVAFLRSLMPAKPLHELYISIGHHKHGKTEFYRALTERLTLTETRFEPAEGVPGLVMIVFTLPAANAVFKVIRDRFGPSKTGSRDSVQGKYRLVFRLDRVGRLVDAQEFEHLHFPLERFPEEVLRELLTEATDTVRVDGDSLLIRHLYVERRLRPLDVYLREETEERARAAISDYGWAIRDLACANIFPGDLLLKNFGVSRHGRVIFYDYDELCLLTDVRFRTMPKPRSDEDELGAEPWFSVDEGDVFPEEFLPFLVPAGPLRDAFVEEHGPLLTPAFWRELQERQRRGEIPDFCPYPAERRLDAAGEAPG